MVPKTFSCFFAPWRRSSRLSNFVVRAAFYFEKIGNQTSYTILVTREKQIRYREGEKR